jgi:heme-degrading monooxygenase HmoA
MPYILVRHKVADFSKWKPVYDAHLPARKEAGIEELHVLRNVDDPNEVVVLSEVDSLQKARDFAASSDLREKMQEAGVVDRPDIYFLE